MPLRCRHIYKGTAWPKQHVTAALPLLHELYRLSRGLELVRVTTIGPQKIQPQLRATVGILRNKATGDEQALAIAVEPQPPHRITGLPILHRRWSRPGTARPSVTRSEPAQLQEIGSYLKRLTDAESSRGSSSSPGMASRFFPSLPAMPIARRRSRTRCPRLFSSAA